VGSYFVFYQITAIGSGHLVLTLNGIEQLHTIVSKNSQSSQLVSGTVVTTYEPNTTLTIRNPLKANTTLRLTANEGASLGVSNHLVIIEL
jgi:hypothetical protein